MSGYSQPSHIEFFEKVIKKSGYIWIRNQCADRNQKYLERKVGLYWEEESEKTMKKFLKRIESRKRVMVGLLQAKKNAMKDPVEWYNLVNWES